MNHVPDPRRQHDDAEPLAPTLGTPGELEFPAPSSRGAAPADEIPLEITEEGFELCGRWVRVSLAAFDHVGDDGTPANMVGSANTASVHGSIGTRATAGRRHAGFHHGLLVLAPLVLALIGWTWLGADSTPFAAWLDASARASSHEVMTTQERAPLILTYDTSVLEADHGARLQRQWHEQLESTLVHAPGPIERAMASRARIMRVRVVAFDEDLHDYEVDVELADGVRTRSLPTLRCKACSEARVVALVVDSARSLLQLPPLSPNSTRGQPL